MWVGPLLLALLGASAELEQGVALYQAGQPGPALEHLLAGLDLPASKRELAQMRLYIGLIQWTFKREPDARTQFNRALELDPRIELPKGAPDGAAQLFRSLRPEPAKPPPKKHADPDPGPPVGQRPDRLEPTDPSIDVGEEHPQVEPSPSWIPSAEEPVIEAREEVPTYTWVILGTGGAAFLIGTTLAILSLANGSAALEEPDKTRARELHRSADNTTSASLVAFVASGALIGAGALTLSF